MILAGLVAMMAATAVHAQTPTPTPTPTPAPAPTPQPDLAAAYRQFVDAFNRRDIAGVMAVFANDAQFVGGSGCPPQNPCVGKTAIQADLERRIRNEILFIVISIQVSGDTATARLERRGLPVQETGLERVLDIHTVTFSGDKISRFVDQLDLSDPQSTVFENVQRINAVTTRWRQALNGGDVAAVMLTFGADAVFEGFGLCSPAPCGGKAAIQRETERQVADHIRIAVIPRTAGVSGNIQTLRNEIRGDSIRAAGVERVVASTSAEVLGDRIVSYRFVLDSTDPQTATYLAALRAGVPGPPRTGNAGLAAEQGDAGLWLGVALGVLALTIAAGGRRLTGRGQSRR